MISFVFCSSIINEFFEVGVAHSYITHAAAQHLPAYTGLLHGVSIWAWPWP